MYKRLGNWHRSSAINHGIVVNYSTELLVKIRASYRVAFTLKTVSNCDAETSVRSGSSGSRGLIARREDSYIQHS